MYYISTAQKMNLPSILFKYMRDMVRDTTYESNKMRCWIPLGRLISYVLIERNLVGILKELGLTSELDTSFGRHFNGRNMNHTRLIFEVVEPSSV